MEKDATGYPDEINHHWHIKHPLRILEDTSETGVVCLSCGKLIVEEAKKNEEKKKKKENKCYGCNTCGDFSLHLDCATNPPLHVVDRPETHEHPLVVDRPKTHEHPLNLIPREVSFTCNACGTKGNVSPYVCISCSFMIHTRCSNLPRVIRINRHPHRLSHTFSLGSEKKLDCGVCRKGIDGRYGAYSSSQDGFAVHTGHEEHDLRLTNTKDDHVIDDKRCNACSFHVFRGLSYKCVDCDDFILHRKCARLYRKIRIPLHQHTLTLFYKGGEVFNCAACDHNSTGFRYSCSECDFHFDTQCVSINDPFKYGGHLHPLYLLPSEDNMKCGACDQNTSRQMMLGCVKCSFGLCFACATLPSIIHYEDDPHPFALNHGENASASEYWCDSCEQQVNPHKNFYECLSCGTIVHTNCALGGSFRNLRLGASFNSDGYKRTLVPKDNQATQPFCRQCISRHGRSILMSCSGDDDDITYYCSTCYLSRKKTQTIDKS
ncbi:unnamed protein product [Microthlaspi erraticum]|uniref:Zinc finger PHD-type domain-containing protein n=1 Tax=Microthlaspi erraticum TaxID=1685480 RepID=A0A6D2HH17_9BRAS|nr:unnamed protein product [Microthlaspi erraticum]